MNLKSISDELAQERKDFDETDKIEINEVKNARNSKKRSVEEVEKNEINFESEPTLGEWLENEPKFRAFMKDKRIENFFKEREFQPFELGAILIQIKNEHEFATNQKI